MENDTIITGNISDLPSLKNLHFIQYPKEVNPTRGGLTSLENALTLNEAQALKAFYLANKELEI